MASTGQALTYRELDARSNKGAQLFRSLGLRTGDSVTFLLENHIRFLELCWAAQRSGLYFTCVSTRLTSSEIEYIVRDSGSKVFITSHRLSKLAEEVAPAIPQVKRYMIDGSSMHFESYEAIAATMPATPIADETSGVDMLYSSGTTGQPKAIRRALAMEAIDAPSRHVSFVTRFGGGQQSIHLSPAPLYHASPLRNCMAIHRLGGTVVVMEHFDAELALQYIEQYRANISQWVPTMFIRMLKLSDQIRLQYDVSSMQSAVHAAAPCPIDIKRRMIEWWGPVLHEFYAGTEGNGMCYVNSADWLTHPGTVGRPLGCEIHICDDKGREVPMGTDGIVYFAGGAPFEYHNDPTKTKEAQHPRHAHWTTLGDIGRVDEEGFLYLTDRKSFMIVSGGVNIYPQEVENLLISHPKVADVAVIGVPNEDFGEEVKAVVQPVDWADAGLALADELTRFCRANLSSIKCPRSIDFERELPRHATGKLYKRLLRDRYWIQGTSRIVS
jgi:acyl-CoA synthetase (AMP-forming)/AMP-acid ligase II